MPPPVRSSKDEDYDKHDEKWQKTKRYADDTRHRQGLVSWVKYVVSLWLLGTFMVLCLNNFLMLNDGVLVALLTTTTVNILGLAFIVLRGLFQVDEE